MQTNAKRRYAVMAVLCLVGMIASLHAPKRDACEPNEAPLAAAAADGGKRAWAEIQSDPWVLGEQRTYEIALHVQQKKDEASGATSVDGRFELTALPYAKQGQTTQVRVDIRTRAFTVGNGTVTQERAEAMDATLHKAAYLTVEANGAISQIALPDTMEQHAHALYRSLVAELQLVVQPGAVERWTAHEADAKGEASLSYRRLDARRCEKLRYGYDSSEVEPPRTGRSELTVDDAGRLSTVSSRYQDHTGVANGEVARQLTLQTRLADVERVPLQPLQAAAAGKPLYVGLSDTDLDRQIAASFSLDAVLTGLRAPANAADRAGWISRLAALLRAGDPTVAEQLAALLRTTQDDDFAKSLVAALSGAFTHAAQTALVSLAEDSTLATARRRNIVTHLGYGDAARAETLQGLSRLAADRTLDSALRSSATLALGGSVRHAASADAAAEAEASKAAANLVRQLARAESRQDRSLAVSALGNAGRREVLPALQERLEDSDSVVRNRSVQALRHIPGSDVDALIANRMLSDDDAEVRVQAVTTLAARPGSANNTSALSEALQHDRAAPVRKAALMSLFGSFSSERQPTSATVRALKQAAQHDPDPSVRSLAESGLAELQGAAEKSFAQR